MLRRISLYLAAGLFFLAFIVFLLLLPPLISVFSGQNRAVTALGSFFFKSFSYAAFYIPVYFIISAYLVLKEKFHRSSVVVLLLSTIPFLTLSLFFRVLEGSDSPAAVFITGYFTGREGAFLLFLLFLAELLGIFVVYLKFKGASLPVDKEPALELPAPEKVMPSKDVETSRVDEKGKGSSLIPYGLPDVPRFKKGEDPFFEEEYVQEEAEEDNYPDYQSEQEPEQEVDEAPDREESADIIDSAPPFKLEMQKVTPKTKSTKYEIPADKILNNYTDSHYWIIDDETRKSADILKTTLEEFKIKAEVTGIKKGPVITMFEILPAPGVKLSKIVNLADNIALRLAASRIRIVAPIPGKHAVGIEVPNKHRAIVSFREMLDDDIFTRKGVEIPVVLGKDITGESKIVDLVQTPHLLIAGATGSGKSVCVNSIICSILYKRRPEDVRLILIDPKIVELKLYNDIPHLLTPVITEPKRAFQALQYCIYEMERRYALLDSLGVRDIRAYNKKLKKGKYAAEPLPYIVVIVDEFADLIATSGKELETTLARLAAMARAIGIHLVLATQRPSIDVITGLIKANVPSRIAFMVANKIDSRIILDSVGADKLLGQGDMLFASSWDPSLTRIQGAFVSDDEVERLTDYVKTLGEPDYIDEEIFFDSEEDDTPDDNYSVNDPLMSKSIEIVAAAGKASASYLQRRLKIGYNRAARIVEEMEMRGIVGPPNGSKPREVIHIPEKYREN